MPSHSMFVVNMLFESSFTLHPFSAIDKRAGDGKRVSLHGW